MTVILCLMMAGDIITTMIALDHQGREGNPVVQEIITLSQKYNIPLLIAFLAVKATSLIVLCAMILFIPGRPRLTTAALTILIALNAFAFVSNNFGLIK